MEASSVQRADPYNEVLPLGGHVVACCADAEAAFLRHSDDPKAQHDVQTAVKTETDLLAQDAENALIRVQSLTDTPDADELAALEEEAADLKEHLLERTSSQDVSQEHNDDANWVPLQLDGQTGCRIKAPSSCCSHR